MKDCTFSAFSVYAFGEVSVYSVLLLRYASIHFILSNRALFDDFIPDIDYFTQTLICSGVWATEQCLVAMSRLLLRDYIILNDTTDPDSESHLFPKNNYPPIIVSFENQNHFNVLFPVNEEIKIGYPQNAPISTFLKDKSLSLSKLKLETKYDPSKRARYPSFAGALLYKEKEEVTFHSLIPSTPKSSASKQFVQTQLVFPKSQKELMFTKNEKRSVN
jgi:hypothetical protein